MQARKKQAADDEGWAQQARWSPTGGRGHMRPPSQTAREDPRAADWAARRPPRNNTGAHYPMQMHIAFEHTFRIHQQRQTSIIIRYRSQI